MKTIILTSALLVPFGLGAGNARADHLEHLHDLAESLQTQSAAAAREIYFHLRGAPDYVHLYSDSLELYRQTERLHALVDAAASPQVLDRQIHRMEETQRHIAELVEAMEAKNQAHGVGFHGHVHRHSFVSQYHLERVCNMVTEMGRTIDHMHQDVAALLPATGGLPLPPGVQPQLPPPPGVPAVAPQPVPSPVFPQTSSRRVIQVRKGGFGISLRIR